MNTMTQLTNDLLTLAVNPYQSHNDLNMGAQANAAFESQDHREMAGLVMGHVKPKLGPEHVKKLGPKLNMGKLLFAPEHTKKLGPKLMRENTRKLVPDNTRKLGPKLMRENIRKLSPDNTRKLTPMLNLGKILVIADC